MFSCKRRKFVLALKVCNGVLSGKTALLHLHGHNGDCWAGLVSATRVVLAFSESTALGSSLPSAISRVHAGGRATSALGVGGASRLAGIPGSSMQGGFHLLLIRVVLLNPLSAW
jgi:hypothetical protein